MGTTTLRELYDIGLISREELSALKKKIEESSKKKHRRPIRLRTPRGQQPIPTQQLAKYIDYAKKGNGCHYPQEQLYFGRDRKTPTLTRPVLIVGYRRRGPTVMACPLTAKNQDNNPHFFIEQEQWSLLKTFKQYIKDCTAVPYCETVNICSLELFGYLSPNTTEEIQHWLKQTNTDSQ